MVCLVMEYCEGGDVAHYMIAVRKHRMSIPPERALQWCQQIVDAIAYLHQNKVVHRDLKPQNIFMANEDNLRVGDFGLAQTLERGKRTSQVGTPCYMAPEVLQHDAYAETVDVWGIGCIAIEVLTLDFLWERKGMLAANVASEPVRASQLPNLYPAVLREAVASCLLHTPRKRPTAAALAEQLHGRGKRKEDASMDFGQLLGSVGAQFASLLPPFGAMPGIQELGPEQEHAILSLAHKPLMPDTVDGGAPSLPAKPSRPAGHGTPGGALTPVQESSPQSVRRSVPPGTPGPRMSPSTPVSAADSANLSRAGVLEISPGEGGDREPDHQSSGVWGNEELLEGRPGPLERRCGPLESLQRAGGSGNSRAQGAPQPRGLKNAEADPHSVPAEAQSMRANSRREDREVVIPKSVMDAYNTSGLFGVEPQWRAVVQRQVMVGQEAALQQRLVAAGESKEARSMMRRAMSLTGGTKGRGDGGIFSFGKKSPPGKEELPPASMSKRTPHSISKLAASSERVDESPYDRKVLVAWQHKQYELTYARARWKQARESTARSGTDKDGNVCVEYGTEDEIQDVYKRMFGPPKSRLIGDAEKLMAC